MRSFEFMANSGAVEQNRFSPFFEGKYRGRVAKWSYLLGAVI